MAGQRLLTQANDVSAGSVAHEALRSRAFGGKWHPYRCGSLSAAVACSRRSNSLLSEDKFPAS